MQALVKLNTTAFSVCKRALESHSLWGTEDVPAQEVATSSSTLPVPLMIQDSPAPIPSSDPPPPPTPAVADTDGQAPLTDRPPLIPAGLEMTNMVLHRNYGQWQLIPPTYVKWLLSQLQPVAFSANNLKSLCRKGQRQPPIDLMVELFEADTGVDPKTDLPDDRRLGALLAFLCDLKANRGGPDRCGNLRLPAEWPSDGVWHKCRVKNCLRLQNRFSGEYADFEVKNLNVDAVKICCNQSENRAYLSDGAPKLQNIPIILLVAQVNVVEPDRSDATSTRSGASSGGSSLRRALSDMGWGSDDAHMSTPDSKKPRRFSQKTSETPPL